MLCTDAMAAIRRFWDGTAAGWRAPQSKFASAFSTLIEELFASVYWWRSLRKSVGLWPMAAVSHTGLLAVGIKAIADKPAGHRAAHRGPHLTPREVLPRPYVGFLFRCYSDPLPRNTLRQS